MTETGLAHKISDSPLDRGVSSAAVILNILVRSRDTAPGTILSIPHALKLTGLAVVLVLRTRKPAFRSQSSRLLLWSTLAVAAATFAISFLGDLSALFGFVPLSTTELAAVVAIVAGYVAATEVAKAWFFRLANKP